MIEKVQQVSHWFVVFVLCLSALDSVGWVSLIASQLSHMGSAPIVSVLVIGIGSSLICCVLSNQPMTILFTRILMHSSYSVSSQSKLASQLSLILASNNGPNLALSGALAGLLWIQLLRDKHVEVPFTTFLKYGFTIMIPVIITASLVLAAEIYIFN